MSHQGFIESETSGNADVSADHKGTFAREAAKQEKQVSSGIDFSGDSGYGSITHSPSQGEEFYYQNSGCVTPSRSIEWEVTECPEDEFEYQQQERFIDSDFFFLYELMWKNEAFEPSSRKHESSLSAKESTSDDHYPFDRSFTKSPMREVDIESSNGASPGSDSSEDTSISSSENDPWLTVAYTKHRVMVSLMRDLYAIFNSQWRLGFRSQTASQSASPNTNSQDSSSLKPSSTGTGKRKAQDEGFHPSDVHEEKKRKTGSSKSGNDHQGRLLACCFYKYNTQKYCSNSDTGTQYRSCAGPGFPRISQLKQHLRRIHRAPIYCPRCWLVMDNQTEMTLHANAEERCERGEPQALEGVDNDKMRTITETRGITWEGVYEIIFPGAPIPSPYYEVDEVSAENVEPSSPRSESLRNFETYNQTALPLLVEANLRAIVDSLIAPIEERLRATVVDIVRTCQSTVAHNFNLTIAPTSSADDRMQPHSQIVALGESSASSREEPARLPRNDTADNPLDLYREPPHLNAEASTISPDPVNIATVSQNLSSDSGYSSIPHSCACSCHNYSNTENVANGPSSCESCADMHFDIDFGDLNDVDPGDLLSNFDFDEDGTGP